jgi:hypothetical protein
MGPTRVMLRGRYWKNNGGASPHLFQPMYAGANMGHPSIFTGICLGLEGDGLRFVNFPHLPTKNVVRYGAPHFVAGPMLEFGWLCSCIR